MLRTLELLDRSKAIREYEVLDFKTFPHHKHTPKVGESEEINLEDILKLIEEKLKIK